MTLGSAEFSCPREVGRGRVGSDIYIYRGLDVRSLTPLQFSDPSFNANSGGYLFPSSYQVSNSRLQAPTTLTPLSFIANRLIYSYYLYTPQSIDASSALTPRVHLPRSHKRDMCSSQLPSQHDAFQAWCHQLAMVRARADF